MEQKKLSSSKSRSELVPWRVFNHDHEACYMFCKEFCKDQGKEKDKDKKYIPRFAAALALFLIVVPCALHAAQPYEVTIERAVSTRMRDGVTLKADIYRPRADGQFPVLLQRTPYNKSGGATFGLKA